MSEAKRGDLELAEALRVRAVALTGTTWEVPATRDMMIEAAEALVQLRLQLAARIQECDRLREDVGDWILVADGIKHDPRCRNHFMSKGNPHAHECLRCEAERGRKHACLWTPDNDGDVWATACGELFQFGDGGPKENQAAFCQYCGGRLVTVGER